MAIWRRRERRQVINSPVQADNSIIKSPMDFRHFATTLFLIALTPDNDHQSYVALAQEKFSHQIV